MFVTQKLDVDDAVLGFVHGWIAALAEQCEWVTVVPLRLGHAKLPANVDVITLPETPPLGAAGRALAVSRGLVRAFRRNRPNLVIAHMCPDYALVASPWCRVFGARLALWYAHGSVTRRLRLATAVSDVVLTSTSEGFNLASRKKRVVGQGVDVEAFRPKARQKVPPPSSARETLAWRVRIAAVARLSEAKGQRVMVDAVGIMAKKGVDVELDLIGPPLTESDMAYRDLVFEEARAAGLSSRVSLIGPIANARLPDLLAGYDLFYTASSTGSLDKAILEAMAMGIPVVGWNAAWSALLPAELQEVLVSEASAASLADKTCEVLGRTRAERAALGGRLREIVVKDHSLASFATRVLDAALR